MGYRSIYGNGYDETVGAVKAAVRHMGKTCPYCGMAMKAGNPTRGTLGAVTNAPAHPRTLPDLEGYWDPGWWSRYGHPKEPNPAPAYAPPGQTPRAPRQVYVTGPPTRSRFLAPPPTRGRF
jgi:hypothetical protein